MKEFQLTKDMIGMGGAFYPKGYAFIMFPNEATAREAVQGLGAAMADGFFLTPQDILHKIAHADGDSAVALPSVGTEGATVQKFVKLAREGHHALMLPVDSREAAESIMAVVRELPYSYAQRYHALAIEDLE